MSNIPFLIDGKNIDQLYEESKGIIYEMAWKYSKKFRIPFEDCHSFGNQIFMKAVEFWKPEKQKATKFSSFFYWRLSMQFLSYTREYHKDSDALSNIDDFEIGKDSVSNASFEFKDYLNGSLDSDSLEVVSLVMSSAFEFMGITPSLRKKSIFERFRTLDWSEKRFYKACHQIRKCLKAWSNESISIKY